METHTYFIHNIKEASDFKKMKWLLIKLKEEGIIKEVGEYCDAEWTGEYSLSYTVTLPKTQTP